MKARTARLLASWVLVAAAVVSPVFAHTGGSNGYASVAIDRDSVRYSLTLWPAALPPAIGDELRRARAGDPSSRQRLLGFIRHKVTLRAGRRRCEPGPGSWPAASPSAESVTLVVDFTCGGDVRDLSLRDDLFDVFGADYHTLARIDAPGRTTQFAFTPVVARRWLVSFCFGLVHGFGFSAALRELGLSSQGLLLSLFGFNAGVEIGQALVVAVAVPALVLVRDTRWERRMIWSSSLAI